MATRRPKDNTAEVNLRNVTKHASGCQQKCKTGYQWPLKKNWVLQLTEMELRLRKVGPHGKCKIFYYVKPNSSINPPPDFGQSKQNLISTSITKMVVH